METLDETSPRYEGWQVVAASGVAIGFTAGAFFMFAVFVKPLARASSYESPA